MSAIEGRYQGRFDTNVMGDFCWYYNVRARARHIKEKPNASNISKAVSHNILQNKIHLLSVALVCLVRNGRS